MQNPLCDIPSIGGCVTGPGTVPRLFFIARCSVDRPLKVRQAAVLTPPFLFLRRRRVGAVKTLKTRTALPFAQPPDWWCGQAPSGGRGNPPPPVPSSEPPPLCDIPSGWALDSHPFCPSHVASGRCVLSAAAAGAPAGVVSAFAEPRRWCVGAVLDVAGAVCASAAPNSWRIGGCAGCCGGRLTGFAAHTPVSTGPPRNKIW